MKQLDMLDQRADDVAMEHHLDHKLQMVLEWCRDEAPDWFDDSFLHSLYIQHFESIRGLSEKQIASIDKIIVKFNIKI